MEKIVITGCGTVSSLGADVEEANNTYRDGKSLISYRDFVSGKAAVATLSENAEKKLNSLILQNLSYRKLDRSVLLAILASREAAKQAGWAGIEAGVNIGSSRGATSIWEKRYEQFLESGKKTTSPFTSPTTTLGNISSWVMQDLRLNGPEMSHSMTCSTGLQSIANSIAWIRAGYAQRMLAGGSEAPLTDFTIAQMQSMKIYSSDDSGYPCRPMAGDDYNRMVLGEGSAVFALEKWSPAVKALAEVRGIGFGSENLDSPTSISEEGDCFYKSMKMALKNTDPAEVDAVFCHAPGTSNGDSSELKAIQKLFSDRLPIVLSNKWMIGHTLGAAGVLSLVHALSILETQSWKDFPYSSMINNISRPVRNILVNAAGFGGNAVSVLVSGI